MKYNLIDGNNVFMHAFHKHKNMDTMISDFIRISHHPNEKTLWLWDGMDSRAYRRALYAPYKVHRDKVPKDPEIFPLMNNFKRNTLPDIAPQLEIPGWEADDVLYNIALHGGVDVLKIYSTDVDLTAIGALCPEVIFPMANPIPNLPFELVCLYKTLVGDTSDGIKGLPGFGPAAWAKLTAEHLEYLEYYLEKGLNYSSLDGISDKLDNAFKTHWKDVQLCYKLVKFRPCPKDEFLGLVTRHVIKQKW